jgi:16S rRNA (guanine1207-N2)-methyltransferase
VAQRYDAIVMNPPFHTGRAAEPGLGQALIAAAARALRKGGTLLMVANRQLPYEADLVKHFARVEKLAQEETFKIFRAAR